MAEGTEATFGWLVVTRAWFAAWAFFESKLRDAVLFGGLFAAGGAVYWHLYGLPATRDQVVPVLIFTIGPIVALWVLLFIWHLWLAPSALIYEAARKTAIPALQASPEAKRLPPINWGIWKQRAEYSLYEFAKILAKTDPAAQAMNTEASSFARLLLEDVDGGRLKYIREYGVSFEGRKFERNTSYETHIKREDALGWATAKSFAVDHVR